MIKLFGGRIASALVGISVLAMGSSASAQDYSNLNVSGAVKALNGGTSTTTSTLGAASSLASALVRPAVATTTAVTSPSGAVFQAQPAQSVTLQLRPSIAREAAWLYHGGWPLYALVAKYATNAPLDPEMNCLATAVYFEARGESVEGQLAVARVVMNRAASGRYPPSWCQVVKQPYQFSFVSPRSGQFPAADTNCDAWKKAEAVAELAAANVVPSLGPDVLWYHADYVAPSWGQRLNVVEKIGAHIFYRT